MKIEEDKLYSVKIKYRKEEEQAIVITIGKDWILAKSVFDYMIDGYILICKNYIQSITRGEKEVFWESVLKVNNKWSLQYIDVPLSTQELLNWLQETNTVFQIEPKDESVCYIGYILTILNKSIRFKPLSHKGIWLDGYDLYRITSLMLLKFDSDYINSLSTYNRKLGQK